MENMMLDMMASFEALRKAYDSAMELVESMKDSPEEVKKSVVCTIIDCFFGERSPEVAQELAKLIASVNEAEGALKME